MFDETAVGREYASERELDPGKPPFATDAGGKRGHFVTAKRLLAERLGVHLPGFVDDPDEAWSHLATALHAIRHHQGHRGGGYDPDNRPMMTLSLRPGSRAERVAKEQLGLSGHRGQS